MLESVVENAVDGAQLIRRLTLQVQQFHEVVLVTCHPGSTVTDQQQQAPATPATMMPYAQLHSRYHIL